jgi:FlaG/FlaF family flagellin (archaellin)
MEKATAAFAFSIKAIINRLKEGEIMKLFKNVGRRFRRGLRAVSPVIAVLLMIVIAVAAALFAYAWVMGYLDFLTVRVDQGVQVQAIGWDNDTQTLFAYAQNVGPSDVTIANVYVDDVLDLGADVIDPVTNASDWVLPSGATRMIVSSGLYSGVDNQVTVKITTVDGNIFMLKKTVTYTSGGGWTPTPTYVYYKSITMGTVTGGPLPNFPVLISITGDSDIAARAATGDQIYFTDDTGTTVLSHELVSYSAGSVSAWVKIPSLDTGTVIRIYYGATRPAYTPAAVWNDNYKGVWHLEETGAGDAGEYVDSTSNNNDGQGGNGAVGSTPVRVSGKIGYAQDFISDFINVGTDTSLKIQSTLTLEAWVKMDGTGMGCVVCRQLGSSYGDGYVMFQTGGGTPYRASFYILGLSTQPYSSTISPSTTWHHWAVTVTTGTSNLKIYIDGQPSGSSGTVNTYPTLDDNPVIIGGGENGAGSTVDELFDGAIDEVRISNVVRSPGWIATEYASMNNPAGFISLGSEVQETI